MKLVVFQCLSVSGTYSPASVPPTSHAVEHTSHALLVSKYPCSFASVTPDHASCFFSRVPPASVAGFLPTRMHLPLPVHFSNADDTLLLREFAGQEQAFLYSVTYLGGSCSFYFLYLTENSRCLLPVRRLPARKVSNLCVPPPHLKTTIVFTKLLNTKRVEGIVKTLLYRKYSKNS